MPTWRYTVVASALLAVGAGCGSDCTDCGQTGGGPCGTPAGDAPGKLLFVWEQVNAGELSTFKIWLDSPGSYTSSVTVGALNGPRYRGEIDSASIDTVNGLLERDKLDAYARDETGLAVKAGHRSELWASEVYENGACVPSGARLVFDDREDWGDETRALIAGLREVHRRAHCDGTLNAADTELLSLREWPKP